MKRIRLQTKSLSAFAIFAIAMLAFILSLAAIPAQAQTFTTLYNFAPGGTDAQIFPAGTMAQGRDGDFYGMTNYSGKGVIYKVSSTGAFTILHELASSTLEGQNCNGLRLGTDGNFYGTCFLGGTNDAGTFFKVTSTGTFTVMHNFGPNGTLTEGCSPLGTAIQGIDGSFYGTTYDCGARGFGTVYKISLAGAYTQLYSFNLRPDVARPQGELLQGSDGNFWGTATGGGISGCGGVFKMTPAGKETVVYSFDCTTGNTPVAGLIQGSDGNYYGTTKESNNPYGTIFKITSKGVQTVLHTYSDQTQGALPILPLTQGPDGLLYGIATDCAGGGCAQAGLFDVTTAGVYNTLYLYPVYGDNANEYPLSPLLLSTDGTFYSTTQQGGLTTQVGTFYSLSTKFAPFVSLVNIRSGKLGTQVGILGQGFSSSSVVKFGGTTATTTALTGTTFILATLPAGAHTGTVTVTTGATTLTSNTKFSVTPVITSFTPPSGPVGTSVMIAGTELSQASRVTFGGVAAKTFTVNSDSLVTATVPTGAKTGKIAITTPGGVAPSAASFTVN